MNQSTKPGIFSKIMTGTKKVAKYVMVGAAVAGLAYGTYKILTYHNKIDTLTYEDFTEHNVRCEMIEERSRCGRTVVE